MESITFKQFMKDPHKVKNDTASGVIHNIAIIDIINQSQNTKCYQFPSEEINLI